MRNRKSVHKNRVFNKKKEQPIPSREVIMTTLARTAHPLKIKEIFQLFNVTKGEVSKAFQRRLRAMERDGLLLCNRQGYYKLAGKMNLIRGIVLGHPKGFGFLAPEDGSDDLFLSPKQMLGLLDGDRVSATVTGLDNKGRREATVLEILERNTQTLIGCFTTEQGVSFVEPSNSRFSQNVTIPKGNEGGAEDGQIVTVQLIEQPTKYHSAVGKVIEILGDYHAPGMEIEIAIRTYDLPHVWNGDVLNEIADLTEDVPESVKKERKDLRHIPFVTIDGEDARDFDDAVYCEPRGKGWLLQVAIADVSAYVKPNTALDKEAQNRGTSVYFPDRVIPMLPEILSNGLCSLKPNVDRLCIVCEMAIDAYGRIRRTQFFEAVMHSAARLTYTIVAKVLAGNKRNFKNPELSTHLENLYQLYKVLKKRRENRGAIDFETIETRIIFDSDRKIKRIVPVIRNEAHKLIEEMMLAANVATAEWLKKQEMPFLYRVHEGPNEEKLAELQGFLGQVGLRMAGKDSPEPKHYAKLLEKIQERPDKRLIQTVLLRSLRMAVYQPDQKGHFGLAYENYTHFTSPIRRYPDLLVHRAIRHCLQGKIVKKFPYSFNNMQALGEQCSTTERRADEATRDAINWLKCEYMQDKIGEDFEGLITGVTAFGIFVELDNIFVEGLVHVTALRDDYYHFDSIAHCLRGERSGRIYRLSDRIQVKVVRVNLEERKIDFELK